eukprot:TRINITY_DN4450_c2_g1_i1.p1 TRINITY_DN4450_c2_g1~~TRINITY_DN4450_c2_g1_i1.p1  ORF type:complete len:417 (+),score=103.25 TRINITY_DN4450_c2_g1_i1:1978-3228(+)
MEPTERVGEFHDVRDEEFEHQSVQPRWLGCHVAAGSWMDSLARSKRKKPDVDCDVMDLSSDAETTDLSDDSNFTAELGSPSGPSGGARTQSADTSVLLGIEPLPGGNGGAAPRDTDSLDRPQEESPPLGVQRTPAAVDNFETAHAAREPVYAQLEPEPASAASAIGGATERAAIAGLSSIEDNDGVISDAPDVFPVKREAGVASGGVPALTDDDQPASWGVSLSSDGPSSVDESWNSSSQLSVPAWAGLKTRTSLQKRQISTLDDDDETNYDAEDAQMPVQPDRFRTRGKHVHFGTSDIRTISPRPRRQTAAAELADCPLCGRRFPSSSIEQHVNRCLDGLPDDELAMSEPTDSGPSLGSNPRFEAARRAEERDFRAHRPPSSSSSSSSSSSRGSRNKKCRIKFSMARGSHPKLVC